MQPLRVAACTMPAPLGPNASIRVSTPIACPAAPKARSGASATSRRSLPSAFYSILSPPMANAL